MDSMEQMNGNSQRLFGGAQSLNFREMTRRLEKNFTQSVTSTKPSLAMSSTDAGMVI
jgi:hypothetical protein